MKPCTCGGALRRHRKALIKTTGEQLVTLLCRSCGERVSIYTNSSRRRFEEKRCGRPRLVD